MNLSWANQIAKTALKSAQKRIDSVLDIHDDQAESSENKPVVTDDPLLPLGTDTLEETPIEATTSQSTETTVLPGDGWAHSWGGLPTDSELVVESEPNPIRDDGPTATTLLDHSPLSNSSDGVDNHDSPSKCSGSDVPQIDNETVAVPFVDVDINSESIVGSFSPGPPIIEQLHTASSECQQSHRDEVMTVASSDIEVIRNVDAWSIASSKQTTSSYPSNVAPPKLEASAATLQAELRHAEQRRNELKAANDTLQKNNSNLQHRITALNQQQNNLKKELEDKKTELNDLLEEGKRLSDHSGKQAREIRRIKNELGEMERLKAERKRLKEEKTAAEETIELQTDEIVALKNMVKSLESSAEQVRRDNTASAASSEVVQRHVEEQSKRITLLEDELKDSNERIMAKIEENNALKHELEEMKVSQFSDRVASERANESSVTIKVELEEVRSQKERAILHSRELESRLEAMLVEKSSFVDQVSRACAPLHEEIADLKSNLLLEREASEEASTNMLKMREQLESAKSQLQQQTIKNEQSKLMHAQELEAFSKKFTFIEEELKRSQAEWLLEKKSLTSDVMTLRQNCDGVRDENVLMHEEANTLRKSLKEFRDENEELKSIVGQLRTQLNSHEASANLTVPKAVKAIAPARVASSDVLSEASEQEQPLSSSAVPSHAFSLLPTTSSAAEVELASLVSQHDASLKRIAMLEREVGLSVKQNEQISMLKRHLKDAKTQYDQLLEVDGERLEKIEELQQDIIDLRQLLKDQLIAFADAKERDNAAAANAPELSAE